MRKTLLVLALVASFLLVAGVVGQTSGKSKAPAVTTCPAMTDLATAAKALDDAIAAVKGGEKDKALTDLNNAKELLAKAQTSCKAAMENCQMGTCPMMGKAAANKIVNIKCPMTGNAIDPAKVPASLTREFKGQKVGFCCPMCPPQWDKLSDKEKQAKLDAVLAPADPAPAAKGDCCK